MILGALARYAEERLQEPPEMYITKNVRYLVDLDSSGRCVGITEPITPVDNPDTDETGRAARQRRPRRGVTLAVPRPAVNRSGYKPKPLLLADNGEYALCVGREGVDEGRVAERHASFVALLSECYGRTASDDVGSVLTFLDRLAGGEGDPASASSATPSVAYTNLRTWGLLPDEFDPTGTVTYRVEGRLVVEEDKVMRFWADHTEDETLPFGRCYVTGEVRRLVRRMPGGVRGVPGGQASGAKLVAVNRDAFESYGLSNAFNCPVSREAAIKVDAALNSLVSDPQRSFTVGGTVYAFFTLGTEGNNSLSAAAGSGSPTDSGSLAREVLAGPTQESITALFSAVYSGEQRAGEDDGAGEADISRQPKDGTELYCLALSATSSRLVVKDFLQAPVPEIFSSLERWFVAQRIVTADGEDLAGARGVFGLIAATLPAGEDLSARLEKIPSEADDYVSAALSGDPLPEMVFDSIARRNCKERRVGTHQAQLLKLALTLKGVIGVRNLEELTDEPDLEGADRDAYFLGRLLACLESIQLSSQGRVNSGIVDRHYTMASTTPASGFTGPLSLAHQAHLPKLRRRKPGIYKLLNEQLEGIHAELPLPLPTSLTTERQGLFAIGYYHQSTHNRHRALARSRASTSRTS